ncbi:MAG TPA: tRNA epoxyqueuosine(34) reductase QueG [Chloroflexota bacterium]|nr:tRNA epoxyqueuosine(34) reductase QueG [Chloroflexota bacterium]
MSLTDDVKRRASELGFHLVGVTSAERFASAEWRLVDWLQAGRHAELSWMTPERVRRSCRPTELLAGARSLIVVGVAYAAPQPHLSTAEPTGRIARYARSSDYHDVMGRRLRALADYLRQVAGSDVRTRVFVDSSPLAEREAAVRAGLGFFGKNTNLLTAVAGSWVLLGAVLTDLALGPDRPVVKDCGQCRLCLDACPTGALPAPYVLDANRCISYLTIEHRGPIAPELRPSIGDHVFGCDICQEVCPWNRANRSLIWPELLGDERSAWPLLVDLLDLDDDGFQRRFKGTPITRAKRRGLLRNAAVALGNQARPETVPVLARALADPEPLVRGHAAWALGRIGSQPARAALERALTSERDPYVRRETEDALSLPGPQPRAGCERPRFGGAPGYGSPWRSGGALPSWSVHPRAGSRAARRAGQTSRRCPRLSDHRGRPRSPLAAD